MDDIIKIDLHIHSKANISLKLQIDESTNNITVANESINKSFVILGDVRLE